MADSDKHKVVTLASIRRAKRRQKAAERKQEKERERLIKPGHGLMMHCFSIARLEQTELQDITLDELASATVADGLFRAFTSQDEPLANVDAAISLLIRWRAALEAAMSDMPDDDDERPDSA